MAPRVNLGSGRYETLFRLGRGGMAEVFAGRLRGEGDFTRLVAIKRMLPHLASDDALVRRFLDEARLAAHVHSAHVVSTLDVGRDEHGGPFIVLELVIGVTLGRFLEAAPATLAERAHVVAEVALGLAEVHEARGPDGARLSMVHRDVSPANVLVGTDGRARLADFGIARAEVPRERTAVGQRLGKPGYMAPEQVLGGVADARSDVWALGVVLWEALAQRRLFPGGEADATREAPPLRWIDAEIPELLAAVAARALDRDPAARFADARELSSALVRALGTLPPSDPSAIAAHVRTAGAAGLVSLEEALRAALGGDDAEPTGALALEEVTVSGLLGDGWDPHAVTHLLEPATATERSPVSIRKSPWRVVALAAVGATGLGLGLAAAIVLSRPEPPVRQTVIVAPRIAPAAREDAAEPVEPAVAEPSPRTPSPEVTEPRAPARRRAVEPTPDPPRAGTVGLDVFDRGGR